MPRLFLAAASLIAALYLTPQSAGAVSLGEEVDLVQVKEALHQGDYKLAIALLGEYVSGDPTDADAFNLMGYSFRKLGQFDKAKSAYDEALALNPAHLGANEYLGELYVQTGQIEKATVQLAVVRDLCGNETCEEYRILAESIAESRTH